MKIIFVHPYYQRERDERERERYFEWINVEKLSVYKFKSCVQKRARENICKRVGKLRERN